MSEERYGRLQKLERLKNMLSSREERIGAEVRIIIMLFKDVKKLFDESISKLITELRVEIDILDSVGDDMIKESSKLQLIEEKFEKVNQKLSEILITADKGLIKSIYEINLEVGADAWNVIEEVNTIRAEIDRWAKREIREYNTVIEAVSREFDRRGISDP